MAEISDGHDIQVCGCCWLTGVACLEMLDLGFDNTGDAIVLLPRNCAGGGEGCSDRCPA